MRSEEEAKAPLEAYYVAPKHKIEKLLDTLDWSLIDMLCSAWWFLLMVASITFFSISEFWINHNQIIDGVAVICIWLMLITHTWLHRRKKAWYDFLPTWFELTPTWRKRVQWIFLIPIVLCSILMPISWMMEHVFELTAFDF